MPDQLRILLVGLATLDLHMQNFCMPAVDDHSYLENYCFSPGGSALNMAFSLTHLGASVTLCTRLGNDFAGSFVREFIERLGIRLIAENSDIATGFSVISSAHEGRIAIAHFEGANNEIAPADLPLSELAQSEVLHIGGAMSMSALDGEPLLDLLKQARSLNKMISLHTSRNTDKKDLLLDSLPYLDLIFLNAKEAKEITGRHEISDAANRLRNYGVQTVAITLGSEGAYVLGRNFSGYVAAEKVFAVDSTGCGDAFVAGFLFAFSRNLNLHECAVWGNVIGGLCAQSRGPVPQPFTRESVETLSAITLTKQLSSS